MSRTKKRSLDRLLRTLRGTMRTHDLPRPDRLVISTRSGSVHLELTSGVPRDRVTGLLDWADLLHGVHVVWTHRTHGLVDIAATGHTTAGTTLGIAATVTVVDLGGHLVDLGGATLAVVTGLGSLAPFEWHSITSAQLRQALTTTKSGSAVPVASLTSEVAA
jgi:hypothetical protein